MEKDRQALQRQVSAVVIIGGLEQQQQQQLFRGLEQLIFCGVFLINFFIICCFNISAVSAPSTFLATVVVVGELASRRARDRRIRQQGFLVAIADCEPAQTHTCQQWQQ